MFEESLDDKVKKKLVHDAANGDSGGGSGGGSSGGGSGGSSSDKAQKKKEKQEKKQKEEEKKKEDKQKWNDAKSEWESKKKEAIDEIVDYKMQCFSDWNKKKRELTQAKMSSDQIEAQRKSAEDEENSTVYRLLNSHSQDINNYIDAAIQYKPRVARNLTYDNQWNAIMTAANDEYAERVKLQMKLAKSIAKLTASVQLGTFDVDKINQELANIPLRIEETIDKFKTIIETLLGKAIAPVLNPDLPEFDVDALIGKIKSFLSPVMSTMTPLMAILGKIPVLGDLIALLNMLSGSGSGIDKETLLKLLPKKPELDPQLMSKISQLIQDIISFCMTLPTLLIQVIFEMINVIYSKLKIITSVIPLGGMFPLTLITSAIEATPKILALIKVLPGMMWDLVKGAIKDKLWESMALAFPTPNIDLSSLVAMAEDINEQKQAKKSKAEKVRDYSDITEDVFNSTLSAKGYTLMQAKNIQTNYKKIYNGNDASTPMITLFEDNGKEQNLDGEPNEDGTPGKVEPGFTESQITRTKPSTADYETYINRLISESDLSSGLKYEKIKDTKAVVGEYYQAYKDKFQKYGNEVVLKEQMSPARQGFWMSLVPQQFK